MTRTMPRGPGTAPPWSATLLNLLAAVLRSASNVLERRARRVAEAAQAEAAAAAEQLLDAGLHTVEFHPMYRDSSAPEGAIYVNGMLVGRIDGVQRL